MKEQLGNFRILEQIDKGGDTVVYRAEEDLGQGITRPAAIKVLQTLKLDDEEQMDTLKREVGILLAVSNSPNIVTVYGFGIDEEAGAWIAMELAGKSLKHYVTDKPADPDQVRVLLRDGLNGLRVCHAQSPPIVHRDLKPNNILSNNYGTWQIADFGLAKRSDSSDTLNVMTVKYAAPEMLDAQLGEDSPKLDIYSLGMVAYEYALGQELFKQQFPSVYDPQGGGGGDERPKWMYFHTSMQMTVPPLKEVIEDYPEDLSDLIAAMMTKPVRERIDSAEICLKQLGDVRGSIAATAFVEEVDVEALKKKEGKIPKPALFGAIGLLFVVLCVAAALVFRSVNAPTITLDNEGVWETDKPKVTVSGRIEQYAGTPVEIKLKDNSTWPVQPDDTGAFAADIRVPTVGEDRAFLIVYDSGRNQVATRQLQIVRKAPAEVVVKLRTRPTVEGAKVVFTPAEGGSPISTQTDPSGEAEASVPHGRFKLSVEHPRYNRVADAEYPTHDDPERLLVVSMTSLSNEALDAARAKLLAELDGALDLAATGDVGAVDRMKEIRDALHRLGPGAGKTAPVLERLDQVVGDVLDGSASADEIAAAKAEIDAFETAKKEAEIAASGGPPPVVVQPGAGGTRSEKLLAEMASLTDRAAAGDKNAQKRIKEIQGELSAIAERELSGDADKRGALLEEAAELAQRAAEGDPAALKRLQEVQKELAQLSASGPVDPVAARRSELIRELDDLAVRAAAGDPVAIARLREVQEELQELSDQDTSPEGERRRALLAELDDLAERAANGDPAAVERMKDVQRQLAALDEAEKKGSADGDRDARRAALLAEMDDLEERAAAGDPVAVARLKEVKDELAKLDAQAPRNPDAAAKAERRAALLEEMDALADAAAAGDPAAKRRLEEIQQELASLDGDVAKGVARAERSARREALLEEMDSLAEAAAAGDPKAIARLAEIRGELQELNAADVAALDGGPNDARKREILAEMDRLAAAAANGDPDALARMNELKGELASLDAIDAAGSAPGSKAAKREALVRELDAVADKAAAGDRVALARVDS
ncbi:MAG: protein kinase, partial [Planctomycetota bacterium JB042]